MQDIKHEWKNQSPRRFVPRFPTRCAGNPSDSRTWQACSGTRFCPGRARGLPFAWGGETLPSRGGRLLLEAVFGEGEQALGSWKFRCLFKFRFKTKLLDVLGPPYLPTNGFFFSGGDGDGVDGDGGAEGNLGFASARAAARSLAWRMRT